MPRGLFITGTDTGVGKTHVAAGIAEALARRSMDVGVMKPVETGCRTHGGRMIPHDALRLKAAAEARDALSLINPYRFKAPLAPAVAAELEGKKINPRKILAGYQELCHRHDLMIVEGAGGILVPLTYDYTFLDLMRSCALPAIVVARPSLGTINHTLLTIKSLQQSGVTVAGIVINYAENRKIGQAERTNPRVIERMSGINVLVTVLYGSHDFDHLAEYLRVDKELLR